MAAAGNRGERNGWGLPLVIVAACWFDVAVGPEHLVGPAWALGVTGTVGALALRWRASRPLLVQLVVAVSVALPWLVWGASQSTAIFLPVAVSTYATGRYCPRPAAYLGIPIASGVILVQLLLDPLQDPVADVWAWPGVGIVLWGAGAWFRQRCELESRRDAAREEHSRAVIAEERLHISRELHDILAHSISVMVLQAEAAEAVLENGSGSAQRPLRRIQETGREAMHEIRQLLADQRGAILAGEAVGSATSLDMLVDRLRAAGLPVTLDSCDLSEMPPQTRRAIQRITQEALTNALRHCGPVPTTVSLERTDRSMSLRVENDSGQRADHSPGGYGLIGMRERATSCGASFWAGPRAEGGFLVSAEFPLTRGPAA